MRKPLVICLFLALSARAVAEPLHLKTPSNVITDGGTSLRLPPGYFLEEPSWERLDLEVRRLQDRETRLSAENASLRASASGWTPGWKTLGSAVITAFVAGYFLAK